MEWLKRLLGNQPLTRVEKNRYRWILRNIKGCKSYEEIMTCEQWVFRVSGITTYTKRKLLMKIHYVKAVWRKRGKAQLELNLKAISNSKSSHDLLEPEDLI